MSTKWRVATLIAPLLGGAFFPTLLMADVIINAPRAPREPGWSGPAILTPAEKETNRQIPILERHYRPGHVYGNMVRRHHYRDTIIPSHRDRVEMLETFRSGQPTNGKYVKDKYR
jgi:hypothetical protein